MLMLLFCVRTNSYKSIRNIWDKNSCMCSESSTFSGLNLWWSNII